MPPNAKRDMADDASLSVAVVEDDRGTREGLAALTPDERDRLEAARRAMLRSDHGDAPDRQDHAGGDS